MFCNFVKLSVHKESTNVRRDLAISFTSITQSLATLSDNVKLLQTTTSNQISKISQSVSAMKSNLEQIDQQQTLFYALTTLIHISTYSQRISNSGIAAAIIFFVLLIILCIVHFISETVGFCIFLIIILYDFFGAVLYGYGVYKESKLFDHYKKQYFESKRQLTNHITKEKTDANKLRMNAKQLQYDIDQLLIDSKNLQTQLDSFQELQNQLETLKDKHQVTLCN